jgi:hypothetical protein
MNGDVKQRGELDLPLSANVSEIQVHHYIIDLQCDLHNHVFHGSTTVFFTQCSDKKSKVEQKVCPSSSNNGVYERDSNITSLQSSDTGLQCIQSTGNYDKPLNISHDSGEKEDFRDYNEPLRNVPYPGERKRDVNSVSNDSDCDVSPNKQKRNCTSSCEDTNISTNFLENLNSEQTFQDFTMILDCYKLEIQSVSEEKVETGINSESFSSQNWSVEKPLTSDTLLHYELGDQCVKIQVPGHDVDGGLRAIKVSYQTTKSGHSLKWTKDQDGK